jgi:hypothetical protein
MNKEVVTGAWYSLDLCNSDLVLFGGLDVQGKKSCNIGLVLYGASAR